MTEPIPIPNNWASVHIANLARGQMVHFRPRGHSMEPLVPDRALVIVSPDLKPLAVGDVVLCKVKGKVLFHKVIGGSDGRWLIGNNKGHTNGVASKIYGRCVEVLT